ncbi:hypothetical protein FALBO_5844 [Fusarium albosuccineum]|uniref:Uncharacterized protein n=1 Tax=Fusarium albosuccineum TaxID=1237068 RepID=A0A8H4PCA9_9HYPO|nr:hypothetical protein FALBO_5844 [Fusarium albosuccineum]
MLAQVIAKASATEASTDTSGRMDNWIMMPGIYNHNSQFSIFTRRDKSAYLRALMLKTKNGRRSMVLPAAAHDTQRAIEALYDTSDTLDLERVTWMTAWYETLPAEVVAVTVELPWWFSLPDLLSLRQERCLLLADQFPIHLPGRRPMLRSSPSTGLETPLAFVDVEADCPLPSRDAPDGQAIVLRMTLGDREFEVSAFGIDLRVFFCNFAANPEFETEILAVKPPAAHTTLYSCLADFERRYCWIKRAMGIEPEELGCPRVNHVSLLG